LKRRSFEVHNLSVLTERDLIRGVADRWRKQYFDGRTQSWRQSLGDSCLTYDRLAALDPESATAADVNAIVGNKTWSRPECGVCCERAIKVVVIANCDSDAQVCPACLDLARNLLQE
jgi:hypothetical protein